MDLESFQSLLAPAGQAVLAEAMSLHPAQETFLVCFGRLEKHHPPDLARAALSMAILRQRAEAKFTRAAAMYFTREALEQATSEVVARHRAQRFAGFQSVGDLCCGIGGDAIALAGAAPRVVAVDVDPLRLAMAEQNLLTYGCRERVKLRQADLTSTPPPDVQALFFDPSRRTDGRRTVSVRDCVPSLDLVRTWLPRIPAIAAKLTPAVPLDELTDFDAEVEFVSVDGELKECVLWFGPLRSAGRRATVLPSGHTLAAPSPAPAAPPGPPGSYLYDPDPAVVRAGLVANLAQQLDARPLDATIAYLTADELRPTPFATVYRIEEAMPFQLKQLRARLRKLGVGRVTFLKRGSPLNLVELQWQLRLEGPESRVVVLTKVQGRPFVLISYSNSATLAVKP